MASYIALLRKDKESDYGVEFPDLPGCITAGNSLEEAQVMAEEALGAHVAFLRDDGDPVPAPSSLDSIASLPAFKGAVAMVVELKEVADRAVRINITVPERALAVIDRAAEREGMNRSAYLARAAESLAKADVVASETELKAWAQDHLAKGRGGHDYRIVMWDSDSVLIAGKPLARDQVAQKLAAYVVKRRGELKPGRTSGVEHVAKVRRKAGTAAAPRRRAS